MRPLSAWFDEYAWSHQHPTNRVLHKICVPLITFSVVGLVAALPADGLRALAPGELAAYLSWSVPASVGVLLWYAALSPRLALLALPFAALMHMPIGWLWAAGGSALLLKVCVAVFVGGWVGQFIGHGLEGRKPSFFKDLAFLLIGPAWVLDLTAQALGMRSLAQR